jgi:hypothetical protein
MSDVVLSANFLFSHVVLHRNSITHLRDRQKQPSGKSISDRNRLSGRRQSPLQNSRLSSVALFDGE